MLTKTQFCRSIIHDYCLNNNIDNLQESEILKSSSLAVAMEYLGLIKDPMMKRYANERGGILFTYLDDVTHNCSMLTVRELLTLLPN